MRVVKKSKRINSLWHNTCLRKLNEKRQICFCNKTILAWLLVTCKSPSRTAFEAVLPFLWRLPTSGLRLGLKRCDLQNVVGKLVSWNALCPKKMEPENFENTTYLSQLSGLFVVLFLPKIPLICFRTSPSLIVCDLQGIVLGNSIEWDARKLFQDILHRKLLAGFHDNHYWQPIPSSLVDFSESYLNPSKA